MLPEFIYFDLGNVLCFFDHAKSASQMAAVANSDPLTLRQIVYESDLEHRYETGDITGDQFVEEIARKLGLLRLDRDAMLEAASDMFTANDEILPVFDAIRAKGIPMGILSNTCAAHWDWIVRQNFPQLEGPFCPIVLSFEERAMKPGRDIYRYATEKVNLPTEKIFFTDDREDNIQAAKAYGWNTHHFSNARQLMDVVESWE